MGIVMMPNVYVRNEAECGKILRFISFSATTLEMQRNFQTDILVVYHVLFRFFQPNITRAILSDPEVIKIH